MWQMKTYPKSTLKDLYKNFFQDKFGPGHIISDTTSAGKFLKKNCCLCCLPDLSSERINESA